MTTLSTIAHVSFFLALTVAGLTPAAAQIAEVEAVFRGAGVEVQVIETEASASAGAQGTLGCGIEDFDRARAHRDSLARCGGYAG